MKKYISPALILVLSLSIGLPVMTGAQDRRPQEPSGGARLGAPVPGVGAPARRNSRSRSSSEAMAEIEHGVSEALSVIEDNYVDGKKLDYNNVFKSSIIGMLRTLDPHSNYYDKEEFDELKTDQRSEYYGIGASIQNQTIGTQTDTYITATFANSPAAKAGLRYGDKITAVDGTDMRGKFSSEVRDKIRGPRGSMVRMTLERASNGQTETVELIRDAVPQPSVPDAYMIQPGVGYVDMTRGFNFTTADELQSALESLQTEGMTSLVLDLRNNPGGFLDQAIRVSEMFLKQGQLILSQKGRTEYNEKNYKSTNPRPYTTPLVILVNGSTASASEIVSGAMQDHDRALIVGQTTFGKGLVQGIFPMDYGSGLTLTTAKYYTPSGRLIQRDYSNQSFYDYYTRGGLSRDEKEAEAKPGTAAGPESHTDTGRAVYGGGGITPDDVVKPKTISQQQARVLNPIFFFTRDLVNGRIPGMDKYKYQGASDYEHPLKSEDFPVTDAVYQAFKTYVARDPSWKMTAAQLDSNRQLIDSQLRFNIIMAAYGRTTADRVFVIDDPQVSKALEVLPQARVLAQAFRARAQL